MNHALVAEWRHHRRDGQLRSRFAPCRPSDHQAADSLMEGVEDIPEAGAERRIALGLGKLPRLHGLAVDRDFDMDIGAANCAWRRCASM